MGGADRHPLVLLVEGNPLIGLDLSEALTLAGYRVAGPAMTLGDADVNLGQTKPDVAILEAALDDGDCIAIARTLRRDGVPFLIHSHCARNEYAADDFRDAPWLLKPTLPLDVIGTLDDLIRPAMRT